LTPRSLPAGKHAAYNRQLFTTNGGLASRANHPGRQQTRFELKIKKKRTLNVETG
jgi:hypothetical protein